MQNVRLLLALAAASQLFAGGFWLQLGNPEANAEARRNNAVLVVKAWGCHHPEQAQVSANATGLVGGKLETIALKLIPLSQPGEFALAEQWPHNGRWVIHLTGRNGEQFTNTLVVARPEGVDRLHARSDRRPFGETDLRAMLDKDLDARSRP